MEKFDSNHGVEIRVIEADKIGSATSPLQL